MLTIFPFKVKRVIGKNDARRKENIKKNEEALAASKKKAADGELVREVPQVPSQMFFAANTSLVPPYSVLVDTSFFNRTVQMKLPLLETMMDCLYATCTPIVTDCEPARPLCTPRDLPGFLACTDNIRMQAS